MNQLHSIKNLEKPEAVSKEHWETVHASLKNFDYEKKSLFMNYGFANLDETKADSREIFSANLYHHVVSYVDITNKDVLEIASGRGGGAVLIEKHNKVKSYVATDISEAAIQFCKDNYDNEKLEFVVADADKQIFPDNTFDVILNVESSRCFDNIEQFLVNAYNMLRPGGHFIFADLRDKEEVEVLLKQLENSPFEIVKTTNISKNIIKALDLSSEHLKSYIDAKIPEQMKKAFYQFSAVDGSQRYDAFKNGELEYWSFMLQKK